MVSKADIKHFQLVAQQAGIEGVSNLFHGNFEEGWKNYDARTCTQWFDRRLKDVPIWKGQLAKGCNLLLHYEQGIGEQIYFASVIPDLLATGMHIILEVDERLVTLMQRSFPEVEVIPYQFPFHESCYKADFQCPIGSAMRWHRRSFRNFEEHTKVGYLKPDPDILAYLKGYEGRIGLSWASSAVRYGPYKTIPFNLFKTLMDKKAVISVQYGKHSEKIDCIPDFDITQNIENCAALLSICSKVITISNATAHLAGALGVETHVLVPNGLGRHIYWYPERETVPNYPRAAAYTQMPKGDWAPLVEYITKNIA